MKIGYARVSTGEQNLDLQRDALKAAGCAKIIEDVASGSLASRDGLDRAREMLREGDTLVVWRLDRLGRSLRNLIDLMAALNEQKVGFVSLVDSIDTTTPHGMFTFHLFGALAELERNLIRSRTLAGLASARARGRKGGPKIKLDMGKRNLAVDLYEGKKHGIEDICRTVGITKPTLYRYVRAARASRDS
jgi:DNA invertase Pin-like site-specific DNA recombinase